MGEGVGITIDVAQTPLNPSKAPADWVADIVPEDGRIFAILDASRIRNLPDMLAASNLPHVCLFNGNLAESAAEKAPWLVVLRRGDRLLEQLFTPGGGQGDNPFAFWEAEAGIFLRTSMTIAMLRKHLRRFLKVESANTRAFFFRFWEPSIAAAYFSGINDRPALIQRWFRSHEGGVIDAVVIGRPKAGEPMLIEMNPRGIDSDTPHTDGVFQLSEYDLERFGHVQMRKDIAQISDRLSETFPERARAVPGGSMEEFTRVGMARMMQYGFGKKSTLFTLLAWELHYGPNFEGRDPDGTLGLILMDNGPQNERFQRLKKRMEQIE